MSQDKLTPPRTIKKKVSQVSLERNTNIRDGSSRRKRARCWCFTLNNHTITDPVSMSRGFLDQLKSLEFIFQEEMGKNGTPHLQGCIKFKNQMSFSTLKKFDARIHWEICRNWDASKIYCSKEATRIGEIYSQANSTSTNTISSKEFDRLHKEWFMHQIGLKDICLCLTYGCTCGCAKPLRG